MNLTHEQKDVLVGIYEGGGVTTWNGILQSTEIGISYELQDLGLGSVGYTQYHGNMVVRLTEDGKTLASHLKSRGFESSYKPSRYG